MSGWGAVISEVLLAAVAKPNPEHLRHLLAFLGTQALVERKGAVPLSSTGLVAVGIPE